MGGLLCFEAARYLKEHYGVEPIHLLISGASAPQVITLNHHRWVNSKIKTCTDWWRMIANYFSILTCSDKLFRQK